MGILLVLSEPSRWPTNWQFCECVDIHWGAYGKSDGIYGQRFDSSGKQTGISQFLVNSNTSNKQDNAFIAMADNGSFIVRMDGPGDGGSTVIFGQRFVVMQMHWRRVFLAKYL